MTKTNPNTRVKEHIKDATNNVFSTAGLSQYLSTTKIEKTDVKLLYETDSQSANGILRALLFKKEPNLNK